MHDTLDRDRAAEKDIEPPPVRMTGNTGGAGPTGPDIVK